MFWVITAAFHLNCAHFYTLRSRCGWNFCVECTWIRLLSRTYVLFPIPVWGSADWFKCNPFYVLCASSWENRDAVCSKQDPDWWGHTLARSFSGRKKKVSYSLWANGDNPDRTGQDGPLVITESRLGKWGGGRVHPRQVMLSFRGHTLFGFWMVRGELFTPTSTNKNVTFLHALTVIWCVFVLIGGINPNLAVNEGPANDSYRLGARLGFCPRSQWKPCN